MKNVLLILLVFQSLNLFSQYIGEPIEWDIKTGKLSAPLPTDLPFNIKVKNLGLTSEKQFIFFVWDRNNEKKIEKELKKNGSTIWFEDKFSHKDANIYKKVTVLSQTDTLIESPTRLEHNRVYSIGLMESRAINSKEIDDLKNYLESRVFIKDIVLSEYIKNGKKYNYSTNYQSEFLNNIFPTLLNRELVKYNYKYYYLPNTYNISAYQGLAGLNTGILGFKIENNELTINNNDPYFKIIESIIFSGNFPITYQAIKNKIIELENGLINELDEILKDIVVQSAIAFTFSHDIVERSKLKIKANSGFGVSFNKDFIVPYTNIGINYYFWPVSSNLPISLIHNHGFKRISVYAAITFLELNPPIIDNKDRYGVWGNQTFTGGFGYMIDDGITLNIGAIPYKTKAKNPLVSDLNLNLGWSVTLNIDSAISTLFSNKLKKPSNGS